MKLYFVINKIILETLFEQQEENIESLNLQIQDIKRGRDQEKKEVRLL